MLDQGVGQLGAFVGQLQLQPLQLGAGPEAVQPPGPRLIMLHLGRELDQTALQLAHLQGVLQLDLCKDTRLGGGLRLDRFGMRGGLRLDRFGMRGLFFRLDLDPVGDLLPQPRDFPRHPVDVAGFDEQAVRQGTQRGIAAHTDEVTRRLHAAGDRHFRRTTPVEDQGQHSARWFGAEDRRSNQDPLREQGMMLEMPPQQSFELTPVQFQRMERVGRRAGCRVDVAVRRADHETPAGAQQPLRLPEKGLVVGEMLQRLERDEQVDAPVRQRDGRGAALPELQVFACIRPVCVGDRARVDVHAHDGARHLGQHGAAVTLAGGHIQHVEPGSEAACDVVAVEVLHLRLEAVALRHALAGVFVRRAGAYDAE